MDYNLLSEQKTHQDSRQFRLAVYAGKPAFGIFVSLVFLPLFCVFSSSCSSLPVVNEEFPGGFVHINGGNFFMGTPNTEAGRFNNEGPQCQVTVSSFYMSKYQVTQQEYAGIMGKNPAYFKGKGLPAETVSWFDAIAYCNARSLKEGLTPAYTGSGADIRWDRKANGYRLPTEAEWEYACRAGTTTRYWSGNGEETLAGKANAADLSAQKRYKNWAIVNIQDGFVHTAPVGKFMANPWGLYDMHGNVWEWCWDRYGSYSARSKTDPYGPLFGAGRVMRGGSWYNSGYKLRSGFRNYDIPSAKYNNVGFRIVRNA